MYVFHFRQRPTKYVLALLAAALASVASAQPDQLPAQRDARCAPAPSAVGFKLSAPLNATERDQLFRAIQQGEETTEAPASGLDDDVLVATLLRHARTELGQRVRPSRVDSLWAIQPPVRDVVAEFEAARASGQLTVWLENLRSPRLEYGGLLVERCRHLQLVEAGGWPQVEVNRTLKLGDQDAALRQVRARLGSEGIEFSPSDAPDVFDADLVRALKLFQQRRGLTADGVLGPATRDALNISAEAQLNAIEATLERWRWLPREMPADRIEVDIAAATAVLYVGGAPALRMKVIVGDPAHRTPMFSSQIDALILNPPWNVPASIAAKELLPKAARDPGYLARNGFERRDGRLVQRPGPGNSLGRLKFDFPSPFGVYLHDTPGRSAFARPVRALSHGCVRLEKPRELAQALLSGQGWNREALDAAIEDGTTRRISLARRLPLYLVYRTAFVEEDGALNFRPDIYGWDAKLLTALARADNPGPATTARSDSECSAPGHD